MVQFTQKGSAASLVSSPDFRVCSLDQNNISVLYGFNKLEKYQVPGTAFSKQGNTFTLPGTLSSDSGQAIGKLGTNKVVIHNGRLASPTPGIQAFTYSAPNWSATGNLFAMSIRSGNSAMDMDMLGEDLIIMAESTQAASNSNRLRVMEHDGTDFSQVGNTLTVGGWQNTVAALGPALFVEYNGQSEALQAYTWDGSDCATTGTPLSVPADGFSYQLRAMGNNMVALSMDNSNGDQVVRLFKWTGSTFVEITAAETILLATGYVDRAGVCGLGYNNLLISASSEDSEIYLLERKASDPFTGGVITI